MNAMTTTIHLPDHVTDALLTARGWTVIPADPHTGTTLHFVRPDGTARHKGGRFGVDWLWERDEALTEALTAEVRSAEVNTTSGNLEPKYAGAAVAIAAAEARLQRSADADAYRAEIRAIREQAGLDLDRPDDLNVWNLIRGRAVAVRHGSSPVNGHA